MTLAKVVRSFQSLNPLLVLGGISLLLLVFLSSASLLYVSYRRKRRKGQLHVDSKTNEVVIVVLGDLGHSPRTTYHAQSFVKLGYFVNICGYIESQVPYFLYDQNVSVSEIKVIKNTRNLPYLIFAAFKVFNQIYELLNVLTSVIDDDTRYALIQNPPCLPLLALLSFLKITMYPDLKIIVDWHNLNYTILNLKFHNLNHPLVRFLKAYERVLSRRYADLNFTVTEAMRSFLIRDFKLDPRKIITVYDRPSEKFSPLKNTGELKSILDSSNELFGEYDGEKDKILITSTSFTADEDFTILVEALKKLDSILVEKKQDSKVLMIVTGKGPLKKDFIKAISDYNWEQVIIKDIWLSDDDYPRILKVADLGISLHYSSSGLDLPMKIVDLFGSGIPVISMGYPVISELVRKGKNGLVLDDNRCGDEMAEKIYDTLYEDRNLFRQLRSGAIEESKRRWNDEWDGKLGERFRLAE